MMKWRVEFHQAFEPEFLELPRAVRVEIASMAGMLEVFGPGLARPHVDTLNGARHANMKELRFKADDGVWRIAFAFDPVRRCVLLVAGDKSAWR